MPKPSPDGLHVAHGIGGGNASIDNVPFARGAIIGWRDSQTVVFANGDDNWYVSLYDVPTQRISRVDFAARTGIVAGVEHVSLQPAVNRPFSRRFKRSPYQANNTAFWGAAGGGRFAVWDGQLRTSWGLTLPDATVLNMGPDGTMCYKPKYQSAGPTHLMEPDGSDYAITDGNVDYISMHPSRQHLFMQTMMLHGVNMPTPLWAPGGVWRAEAVFVGGEWWMCPYYANHGITLHPFRTLDEGYSILPTGDGWHACAAIDATTVRIFIATSEGEQAGEIWVCDVDVSTNRTRNVWEENVWRPIMRVPIYNINKKEPPPPPPPPPVGTVTIADDWGPRQGTVPLTVAMRANWTGDVAAIQWLRARKGESWQNDDVPRDPKLDSDHHITFTEPGIHVIGVEGRAADGTVLDRTGTGREVNVTTPEPEPEPEPTKYPPLKGDKNWFGPNITSNPVPMFDNPDQWTTAREHIDVFSFYVQHIQSLGPIGSATYERLVEADTFRKLRQWAIATSVEMGVIKPGDWNAENALNNVNMAAQRIADAGGHMDWVCMDEPLTSAKRHEPPMSLQESANIVALFVRTARATGAKVVLIETFPENDFTTFRKFIMMLDERGMLPHALHLDIDHKLAGPEKTAKFIRDIKEMTTDYAMPIGIHLAGYSYKTDKEYVNDVLTWAKEVKNVGVTFDHVLIQSWAERAGAGGPQDIPRNLPESEADTHTALVNKVVEIL